MMRPFYIALLELKRFVTDRGELAFGIALPIILFALMYGVFSGGTTFNGTAHIVDQDQGPVSAELIARIKEADGLKVKLYTAQEADRKLESSAVLTAIVIPEDFSEKLQTGQNAELIIKRRGSGGDEGQIVASIVQGIASDIASEYGVLRDVKQALTGTQISNQQIEQTVVSIGNAVAENPPVIVQERLKERDTSMLNRLLPGILVMFLMFAVTLGSQGLVEERRIGTLERLMTTRLSVNQLFAGKFLAGINRAMLQAIILLALGFAVLRIAGTSAFFQSLVFTVLIAAAVSAIGLVIGAVARSVAQATWTAVFITMYMTVFGGTFFFGAENTGTLGVLSKFTITNYAIEGLDNIISGGESITQQGLETAVLAGIAIVGLIIARGLFRISHRGH